jgi:hypothetical protein
MKFKTLKHKTFPDTFGQVIEVFDSSDRTYEIADSEIPYLQPLTATMEMSISYWTKLDQKIVLEQLNGYEMVEVEVNVVMEQIERPISDTSTDRTRKD